MMTQRAKLRRLAFIDLPSWSRGSRPYVLGSTLNSPWVVRRESPGPLHYNLGGARVDAKGTTQDYLTHPSAIPGQIMARNPVFFGVVKTLCRYYARISRHRAATYRLWRGAAAPARREFDRRPG